MLDGAQYSNIMQQYGCRNNNTAVFGRNMFYFSTSDSTFWVCCCILFMHWYYVAYFFRILVFECKNMNFISELHCTLIYPGLPKKPQGRRIHSWKRKKDKSLFSNIQSQGYSSLQFVCIDKVILWFATNTNCIKLYIFSTTTWSQRGDSADVKTKKAVKLKQVPRSLQKQDCHTSREWKIGK